MHTDSGSALEGSGQTLLVTALIYLNRDWQEGDGGELRVFPYPFAPQKIAPLEGRMVLFEPRMVHDVLPNYKKRCAARASTLCHLRVPLKIASGVCCAPFSCPRYP